MIQVYQLKVNGTIKPNSKKTAQLSINLPQCIRSEKTHSIYLFNCIAIHLISKHTTNSHLYNNFSFLLLKTNFEILSLNENNVNHWLLGYASPHSSILQVKYEFLIKTLPNLILLK